MEEISLTPTEDDVNAKWALQRFFDSYNTIMDMPPKEKIEVSYQSSVVREADGTYAVTLSFKDDPTIEPPPETNRSLALNN